MKQIDVLMAESLKIHKTSMTKLKNANPAEHTPDPALPLQFSTMHLRLE